MRFALPEGPCWMGIVNVTPDSFSDGGLFLSASQAIEHGLSLASDGANLVDVGGESTRPGAEPVSETEELKRVLPVVSALANQGVAVSIDTMKPGVAREAIAAGAVVVNDVTALRSSEMRRVCAETGVPACVMHMKGEPRTMQADPRYDDVVSEVADSLLASATLASKEGVGEVWIDPGIGFGKTLSHNLTLLRGMKRFVAMGMPVLVGVSRKSFIGRVVNDEDSPSPIDERDEGTYTAGIWALTQGARILRVHDVAAQRRAWKMWKAIEEETICE